jgi:hypothetical protein
MEPSRDFEDLLALLGRHEVRYLIVGGLAFVYHAKPRYTKDMDLWIEPEASNLVRANRALAEFGGPEMLLLDDPEEILQIGVAPNRIDLFKKLGDASFHEAWSDRVVDLYGDVEANWIGLDGLLAIKEKIDTPRHQEDARVLREVKRLRGE